MNNVAAPILGDRKASKSGTVALQRSHPSHQSQQRVGNASVRWQTGWGEPVSR